MRDRQQDGGPAGRIPVDPDRRPAVHADGENQQRTQLDQREAGLQPDQLADRRDRLVAARWIAQRRETRVPADIPTGEPGPGVVVGEEDVHISVVGALVTPGQQERPVGTAPPAPARSATADVGPRIRPTVRSLPPARPGVRRAGVAARWSPERGPHRQRREPLPHAGGHAPRRPDGPAAGRGRIRRPGRGPGNRRRPTRLGAAAD